jgi:hypothetical protein
MRKFIPQAILGAMTVLAIVALLVSVSTAARISSFAPPPAGSPSVVAAYRAVVQHTLAAPSFTYEGFLNYQAPDRTATTYGVGNERVIGREVYLLLPTGATTSHWGRGPLTTLADDYYGPARALTQLRTFATVTSVVASGSNFVVQQVVPADLVAPGNPGQVLVTATVTVSGGYVASIKAQVTGWVSYPYAGTASHPRYRRVDSLSVPAVTYANFGAVVPITAPPAAQTVPLGLCGQQYRLVLPGSTVCSLVG